MCYSITMINILEKYIDQKVSGYIEPSRKGVPKGDRIGFPRKKFHAALLELTTRKTDVIASEAGVSYGLLCKWRTERQFRDEVEKQIREFTAFWIKTLIESVLKKQGTIHDYLDMPISKMATERLPQSLDTDFIPKGYTPELRKSLATATREIFEEVVRNPEKYGDQGDIARDVLGRCLLLLMPAVVWDDWDKLAKQITLNRVKISEEFFAYLRSLIANDNPSEDERKWGLVYINYLEELMELEI